MRHKIVRASNFDDENYNEVEILGIATGDYATLKAVCAILNSGDDRNTPHYYKVTPVDYKLQEREE